MCNLKFCYTGVSWTQGKSSAVRGQSKAPRIFMSIRISSLLTTDKLTMYNIFSQDSQLFA